MKIKISTLIVVCVILYILVASSCVSNVSSEYKVQKPFIIMSKEQVKGDKFVTYKVIAQDINWKDVFHTWTFQDSISAYSVGDTIK